MLVAVFAGLLLQPAPLADELSRLAGQRVTETGDSYHIDDIAGEGAPIVGVVERRGEHLYLGDLRLTGPLSRPRITGPGYKVWAIGKVSGKTLRLRRIGILARPTSARYGRTNTSLVSTAPKACVSAPPGT